MGISVKATSLQAKRISTSYRETEDEYWRQRALCVDRDPAIWFGEQKVRPGGVKTDPKRICKQCPVISACLLDVIKTEGTITYGVRGGLDANERIAIIKARRLQ